ncbi:hypothetical protein [Geoalkalibacter halelectricus]|uniref:Uncharacterized protein n=1 Tax=Geoalkalibacter halelectricus TaxID=2847045 RepID=A0ABY5ZJP3_9BACT|nr:hypothetical protein [Geoalkalibacter halelectricus]MDO3378113.1 hypothetical protein [Geoalkalibacter halelectricus]UWZ77959.1 hypothetical protein L9S41_09610 [Geoalkalibacter halelectricus]
MSDEKKKTLSYRKAEYFVPVSNTLEHYLAEAHTKLPEIAQRRVVLPGHPVLECRRHQIQDALGVLLHIAAYTPGEHASVVPVASGTDPAEITTIPPPDQCEFMDGDIMALVSGNHVLLCSSNLHEKKAERYMNDIIDSAKIDTNASKFSLCKRADIDKVRLIQSQGVRSINLNATLFDATLDHIERTTVRKRIGGKLMDEIKALVFEDQDVEQLEQAENLSAQIILKYDSRRKGCVLGRQSIESLANQMLEDGDEGFTIETLGGETIKGSDITLRKTVSLAKHGKSVFCSDAWRALEQYYYELKDAGLLEL